VPSASPTGAGQVGISRPIVAARRQTPSLGTLIKRACRFGLRQDIARLELPWLLLLRYASHGMVNDMADPEQSAPLFDLDAKARSNKISHVFARGVAAIRRTQQEVGRRTVEIITSETGCDAVSSTSRAAVQAHTSPTAFLATRDNGLRCVRSPLRLPISDQALADIVDTWATRLSITGQEGNLRPPQRGALLALLAHWSRSKSPATIVLPTGTGKTETLLLTILVKKPTRTLILVPTDALRDQTFRKACVWGALPDLDVLAPGVLYPVVGVIRQSFTSLAQASEFIRNCNIVVATVAVVAAMGASYDAALEMFDLIAIDEAHHLGAKTWNNTRTRFGDRPIVQFTATPFRHDNRPIGGEILYTYPLAMAQTDGFFSTLAFRPVEDYDLASGDRKIADLSVTALRNDLNNEFQHAMMVRARSKERAESLFELYRAIAPDLNPVLLHTGLSKIQQRTAKDELLSGTSKIVVCVDMLGEGFDFPRLKIAALHDSHRSLTVALQFVGRFSRTARGLGSATVVANIADRATQDALTILYSQDSDWNSLIQAKYDDAVEREIKFQEFVRDLHLTK